MGILRRSDVALSRPWLSVRGMLMILPTCIFWTRCHFLFTRQTVSSTAWHSCCKCLLICLLCAVPWLFQLTASAILHYLIWLSDSIVHNQSSVVIKWKPDLNPSFSANPPYRSLSFVSFKIHCMDFPDCLLLLLSISVFLLFSFFLFLHFFSCRFHAVD